MIETTALFLGVALVLYFILGGADFGAGIIEFCGRCTGSKKHQKLVQEAIGPVWEANHIWLILAVVISFVGFPRLYAQMSVHYHVPLTLLLLGITIRGCAFTYRHYDAIEDSTHELYSWAFYISSLITPFILGTIAGSMTSGLAPQVNSELTWPDVYLKPWLNANSMSVGVFTTCLFAYIAAVYLVGEDKQHRIEMIKFAGYSGAAAVLSGGGVFAISFVNDHSFFTKFFAHPWALFYLVIATILFIPLFLALANNRIWLSRITVSTQVTMILLGWFSITFPAVFIGKDFELTIYSAAAPDPALVQLLIALVVGCCFILPALGYLFYIFKHFRRSN